MSVGPPPEVLPAKPATHRLNCGQLLVRIYDPERGGWSHGRVFGPLPIMRWDHHLPPPRAHRNRSVCYAAASFQGAVGEAFARLGFVDRGSQLRITLVRIVTPLDLLDLVGAGPRSIGLTQEIAATTEYESCQTWARAIYEQYRGLHGIRWRGRQAGSICVVLTDRAPRSSLLLVSDHGLGDAVVWPRLARAARRLRLGIL